MAERTFEVGGEILHVGDTVIVFDGNTRSERAITGIGTKRIFIESMHGYGPVPYSKETREDLQTAYIGYFRTKTEVAEMQRRDVVKSKLRDLGVEVNFISRRDGLERYSAETLEKIAGILEAESFK
jgi:hypothetical protein